MKYLVAFSDLQHSVRWISVPLTPENYFLDYPHRYTSRLNEKCFAVSTQACCIPENVSRFSTAYAASVSANEV